MTTVALFLLAAAIPFLVWSLVAAVSLHRHPTKPEPAYTPLTARDRAEQVRGAGYAVARREGGR